MSNSHHHKTVDQTYMVFNLSLAVKKQLKQYNVARKLDLQIDIKSEYIHNIDAECETYVENIINAKTLNTQHKITDDYYRIKEEILNIEYKKCDIIKTLNGSPNMIRL